MGVRSGTKKEDRGRPGRPRAQCVSENAPGGDDCSKKLRLEKLRDEIRNGHGTPTEKIEDAGFAQTTNTTPRFEQVPEIFRTRLVDRRRRDGRELRKYFRDGFERLRELRVLCRIFNLLRWGPMAVADF